MAETRLLTVRIASDQDVVFARQRARDLAELLGFDARQQSFVATAVSEIVRNAQRYAGGGTATFSVEGDAPQALVVSVRDSGPGIADVEDVLAGRYASRTGMGMGIVGARRLMDDMRVETAVGSGTEVVMTKFLPARAPRVTPERASTIASELARRRPGEPVAELQRQNHELLEATTELRARQEDLERLNAELEATNRGVLALYAELDEKAESLRRASESKTRFLSNMTHEFRTPLNSILGLTGLLLERSDGDLTSEQERQVRFIRRSAEDLSGIVNDLLDLAKVEAGRIEVRPAEFTAAELFAALKGVCRPLTRETSVALVFDDPPPIALNTDEAKVSQILRNFVSNALKYTESGEVRVSANASGDGTVTFTVADTGIGIAPADHERIFEEFTQIEGPRQRKVKGTGLGLPLTRRLADLLGGRVAVESEVGRGSTFSLVVPACHPSAADPSVPTVSRGRRTRPVLAVDASPEALETYAAWLEGTGFHLVPASTVEQARRALEVATPAAIVLDVVMQGESGWVLLEDLASTPATQNIPVLVVTIVENREHALELGAADFARKPIGREWLVERLSVLGVPRRDGPLLAIDDDEVARYLLAELLEGTGHEIVQAASGAEGLRAARALQPAAIFLDLVMPEMSGEEVLNELRRDPATWDIPVVIYTSEEMSRERRAALEGRVEAILLKRMRERGVMRERILEALERCGVSVAPGGATTDE